MLAAAFLADRSLMRSPSFSVAFISLDLWRMLFGPACVSLCLVRRSYDPKIARIRADGREPKIRRSRTMGGASRASTAR
jgi:hypothetical protein